VVAPHLTRLVTVEGGEHASGLAAMVADLLEQNLADSTTRALVASVTRGDVELVASDHDLSVTVSFLGGSLTVSDSPNRRGDVGIVAPRLAGEWLQLSHVCSGQRSPFDAWREGAVVIQAHGHAGRLAAAGFALSAPATRDVLARRRRAALYVTFVAGGLVVGVLGARTSTSRRAVTASRQVL
jgi:hypothetical protein